MENFNLYLPTEVVFGKDTENEVGKLCKKYGAKKVLVHYGGGSVVRSGLLDKCLKALDAEGLPHVELGGVVPNPLLGKAKEGIELVKKEGVDFILAVGGGSVIDSAKCIGYGATNEGDVWDFYCGKRSPENCMALGCVLTIAATGSEMSNSSVITNEDGMLKKSCGSDMSRCKFAVMNPEITYTLPEYQTVSGTTDIMMHTMERFFNHCDNMHLTDRFMEELLKNTMKFTKVLIENPRDYNARAEVMWAGSVSHNDMLSAGNDGGDWATHRLEHELGGMFDVTHGAGLAAVWGSWARFVIDSRPERFAQFATNVMGVKHTGDDMETGLKGIEALENYFREVKMPTNMRELGISPTPAQIEEMADKMSDGDTRTSGCMKKLKKADCIAIYTAAL